ncbi:MAG: acyltransferase [Lachnospiraceae bacterium]|nr:acyltransferase [Lachnospiraceae bacterium]
MNVLFAIYGFISRLYFGTLRRAGEIGRGSILRLSGHVTSVGGIKVGEDVFIGDHFRMDIVPRHGQTYEEKEKGELVIGRNTSIQDRFKVSCALSVVIGEDCVFAGNVFVTDNNHGMDPMGEVPYKAQDITSKPVRIGNGTWIGEKCIILPGADIGEKCIIGAGSVVTGKIPDLTVAVGSPARPVKRWDADERRWVRI